jgi:hypothetical protein
MSPDDNELPGPDVPDEPDQPTNTQQASEASPTPLASNITPDTARGQSIFQRRLQRPNAIEPRRVTRLRVPGSPQRYQPNQGPDVTNPANAAKPSPVPPAPPEEEEQEATTANTIDTVGGRGNTTNQANTIYNTNIILQTEEVVKDLVGGTLEQIFKKAGVSLEGTSEGDEGSPETTSDSFSKASASLEGRLLKSIKSSSSSAAFVNKSRARTKTGVRALPRNDKEIEQWYYQELSERERCFVKAAAVLHGAPLRAIAEATNELYAPLKEQDEARRAQDEAGRTQTQPAPAALTTPTPPAAPSSLDEVLVQIYSLIQQEGRIRATQQMTGDAQAAPVPLSPRDSRSDSVDALLARTHTYTQRVNGALRLFWQDADSSGLSRFSVDLLRFLAREVAMEDMFGTQSGQRFLDTISQWPTRYRGERSWRSAGALGIIWWHQDARNLLWRQANKWARSQKEQDWEHAAALLDGAYQVERDTMKAGADEPAASSVLQLLDQWISAAHQPQTAHGEGYAAARAYALIGRKSPEIALKGLERLLLFPQPQSINQEPQYPPEDLFVFGISKYVDIVKSGHIRQVLDFLADRAEHHSHRQGSLRGVRRENHQQRSAALYIIFTAFFLVASCSLSAADDMVPASYSSTAQLPEHPSCPDDEGRDILLAGLLTQAELPAWRDRLATLLCALIVEKNYQPALYLMRRWGEIVLKKSGDDHVLIESYAQFLIEVGERIRAWSAVRGAEQIFAFRTYTYRLSLWKKDLRLPQPGFEQLAQKVLDRLPETS